MRVSIFYPSWSGGYLWTVQTWGVFGDQYWDIENWPTFTAAFDDWFDKCVLQNETPDPGEDFRAFALRREWMGESIY